VQLNLLCKETCDSIYRKTLALSIKEGISNNNHIVETSIGEYVVKFLVNQNTETLENDVAIQEQLLQTGLQTPKYIRNKENVYRFKSGTITAVISEKLNGIAPKNVNVKLAKDFGQKLATFHSVVKKLPHRNNKGLMNPSVSGVDSQIYQAPLPKGIIHGDFHLGNVLVDSTQNDTIVAMLDFEEAGENLYIVDLALTIMGTCALEDLMDVNLIKAATEGYETIRPLNGLEKDRFSEAIKYAAKAWIKWFKENDFEKYAVKHQKRLDSYEAIDTKEIF